ncbi:hypothetical protein J3A83DRAFT_4192948 [Scleroderma citrinum]
MNDFSQSSKRFLADWEYAVSINGKNHQDLTSPFTTPLDTPHGHMGTTSAPSHLMLLSTSDKPQTSPIPPNMIPMNMALDLDSSPGASDNVHFVVLSKLKDTDDITLAMGGAPLVDPSWPSIDTNPLYCMGTWSWMAVELVMAGAGRPMNHMAHHNLESLFYVLLGISVIYDEPYQLKSEAELMKCFDIYFNTFQLSLLKTITIQSQLGWLANILEHISPYFCPLIPLFEVLHQKIIKLPVQKTTQDPTCAQL